MLKIQGFNNINTLPVFYNTSFVGSVSAANVVSNARLSSKTPLKV
jgi:hypothetical protein